MSNTYTNYNSSSGISGIKSYTITLKKSDNTVVGSPVTKLATDYNYHTFSQLTSNTAYTVTVAATDLAGNTNSAVQSATTPPAKPSGLTFSNTTYSETTLSWTASGGATGYDVYRVDGTTNIKINSGIITNNSFYITGLSPNTNYTYNVIAKSSAGESDRSSNATVKTIALPYITGQATLCNGLSTYSLSSILPNYTITWTWSYQLTYNSGQGTKNLTVDYTGGGGPLPMATLIYNDYGSQGWVRATISNLTSSFVVEKNIWIGKPGFTPEVKGSSTISCSRYLFTEKNYRTVTWSVYGPLKIVGANYGHKCTIEGTGSGVGWVYATASNECGSFRGEMLVEVNCGYYAVSPNPVNSDINISQKKDNTVMYENDNKKMKPIKSVKIFDKNGTIIFQQKYGNEVFETNLNISNFPIGFYIIKINEGNDEENHSIIKN